MVVFPNAKINLGLYVVSKRDDGYHNINTIFLPVRNLSDVLEVIPLQDGLQTDKLSVSGLIIPGISEENLCIKAIRLMREYVKIPPLNIFLHKNIPFGAGLGGGSSDAAFMIKLLNEMFEIKLDDDKLEEIAANIGADCPFFIKNQAVYSEGTGNIFSSIEDMPNLWLELVVPPIHISTEFAYRNITPCKAETNLKTAVQLPVNEWSKHIRNDFEIPVFKKFPELKEIKEKLYKNGAIYASMSGSGASIYGLFIDKPEITWDKTFFVYSSQY